MFRPGKFIVLNVLIFALRDRRKDSALNGSKNSVIVT
jgi:hypothetical protein